LTPPAYSPIFLKRQCLDSGMEEDNTMIIRQPAVANQFYDGNPLRLSQDIERMTGGKRGNRHCFAVVSPHAGYIYSGNVAGAAFSKVAIPETVIIFGPNHTGYGSPAAVMMDGIWRMPMGDVPIATDIATTLVRTSAYLEADYQAHMYEHSLEVQVPFLQYFQPELKIVPVCLGHMSYQACEEIAQAVANTIKGAHRPILMVASTDMTHYESQAQANAKDRLAIEQVLALNPKGLFETVQANGISMCGFIPTTVVLATSLLIGATSAELVKYATSGDVSGDYDRVVGYASFIIA